MPESKKRKKLAYTPPPTPAARRKKRPSPPWLAPLMLGMFVLGILWLVVFYITQGNMPVVGALNNWNLVVGFAFIVVGFVLSTQWR